MKWKFTLAMAAMPWFIFVVLICLPTGYSQESAFRSVAVLFGMVLWPLCAVLIAVFWGIASEAQMAKARSYIVMARAKYGIGSKIQPW